LALCLRTTPLTHHEVLEATPSVALPLEGGILEVEWTRSARSGEEKILVNARNPTLELQPVVSSCIEKVSCAQVQDLIKGKKKKGKAIPVTGREGPSGCETSRLPHFLDNQPTDGGEVVSLTRNGDIVKVKLSL
jgi:hypothetical protein